MFLFCLFVYFVFVNLSILIARNKLTAGLLLASAREVLKHHKHKEQGHDLQQEVVREVHPPGAHGEVLRDDPLGQHQCRPEDEEDKGPDGEDGHAREDPLGLPDLGEEARVLLHREGTEHFAGLLVNADAKETIQEPNYNV